jgi:catechol 2,3-dioxygenase-like lactoylglutathione lyase family enzyme
MTLGVNHITFAISDLMRSLRFYVDVIGCRQVAIWERGSYLRAGDMWLCLSLDALATSGVRDYTHVAFSFDAAGLKAFRTRLAAVGGVEWKVNASEGDSVYFLDPDGHRLEAHVGDLISRLISLQHAPYDGLEIFGDISHTPVSAATEDQS